MTTSSTPRIPASGDTLAQVLDELNERASTGADAVALHAHLNARLADVDFGGDSGRFMAVACAASSVINRTSGGPNSA